MYNSLDIFHKSFLGSIPGIWQNEVPICLCLDGHTIGWQTVLEDIQNVIINVNGQIVFIENKNFMLNFMLKVG